MNPACTFFVEQLKWLLQDVLLSAYAGSGFWFNANYKRQAQHHVLPNCGRKQAPSSCEPTPRLPPELLPEDLWWAPSPGCPPKKEVRPVLGGQPHFGTKDSSINFCGKSLQRDYYGAVQRNTHQTRNSVLQLRNFFHVHLESGLFYLIGNNDISQFVNPA